MLTGWRLTISKFFVIPQRYILGIMGFFAILNAYTMRVSLSVAITEMVLKHKTDFYDPNACIIDGIHNSTSFHTVVEDLYPWTVKQQGLILSSFYWGYVITHIPGGVIAEKFGGKYVLGLGILSTSLFTLLTPFVVYASGGNWLWLVALRVFEGLGEGTTFPALNAILSKWVPLAERAKLGTLVYAGSQIGTVMANSISGTLIHATKSWASVFYFFGVMGCLWTFLWTILCYSDPDSHPFISDKEKNYLKREMSASIKEKRKIPWKHIFKSVPVWALVCAQIGHDWGFFAMVTDLPTYLKEVLHFNVKENGLLSSIPYVVMWIVSLVSAYICDKLIASKCMTISFARKFFSTIGSLGPAVFLLVASYVGCDRNMAIVMFTIGMGSMGCFYCGMKVNVLDLTTHYAGTVMAIVNGIGALSGILVPYLIAAMTENHTLLQWRNVFWVTFGVLFITNAVFLFFGSAEVQPFDSVYDEKKQNPTPKESFNGVIIEEDEEESTEFR
ncbi:putative inorganic phosphate cotransporter isoform X2 [Coccinella septempunctata]|uniref:putative inorganic phosphate cotransporter isoform X2 n=1 Tax=Coccinella septempunctata TaxID=41139 RepID=UPI001D081520|nr:putative inorganic phosphate cotransporter isoform X2 [Coccinella septempunctata]XP_044758923.1 putative inorganic phosphate cotransporter isoform X2 [Coccinella septempunctata]